MVDPADTGRCAVDTAGIPGDRGLRFAVLGPVRAWYDGHEVPLGPARQRALLAVLLSRPDTTISAERLLDAVWGDRPPASGTRIVPVYVYRLRRCLQRGGVPDAAAVVVQRHGGYRFDHGGVSLDATRLDAVLDAADAAREAGDTERAVDAYGSALRLFEGEPLAGTPGPYAATERLRLGERRTAALRSRLAGQLALGRYGEVVDQLPMLGHTHPHDERLAELLMRALHGLGRRADALEVFTQLRRRLVDELGVEPGAELHRVQREILAGRPAPPAGTDRTPAAAPVPDELPGGVGELVGRDHELRTLLAPDPPRRVAVQVVVGAAGAGKTALVVRAARALRSRYPDGCLFVDLHGHTEIQRAVTPVRLLHRLLGAVGADDAAPDDDLDVLVARWRSVTATRRLLLLLDDAAGAGQVRYALPSGPGSRVIVTSRNRLAGLDASRRLALDPLSPTESVRLLGDVIGAARVGREPGAVRELVRLCGGLPLALSIAAARLHTRPTWPVDHLVRRVADERRRLAELTAEDRGVEAAFTPSYEQLPAEQRRAFRALGLAPTVDLDGLTLAAMLDWPRRRAERVLEDLVDASLVQQPAVGRYRLHDLVGVYARRLADGDGRERVTAARTRVLRLYLTAARYAGDRSVHDYPSEPPLDLTAFADRQEATGWLDACGDGLVDVAGYAVVVGRPDFAGWIAEALVDYLTRRGRYADCLGMLRTAVSAADRAGDHRLASSLRTGLGNVHGMQADYPRARAELESALRIATACGDLRQQARALGGLAAAARSVGHYRDAAGRLRTLMALARRLADNRLTVLALCSLGVVQHHLHRSGRALDCLARATRLAEWDGNDRFAGTALCEAGGVLLDLHRYAEAAARLRRALVFGEHAGDVPLRAFVLTRLATAEQGLGNHDGALRLHRAAQRLVTEQTDTELKQEIRDRMADSRRIATAQRPTTCPGRPATRPGDARGDAPAG